MIFSRKYIRNLTLPIFALTLTSCAASQNYASRDTSINLPNAPRAGYIGGKVIDIPKNPQGLNKQESQELIVKLRESEVKNARAVRAMQRFYKKVQRTYK